MRDQLARQLEPYRQAFPNARWVRPAGWHVTLVFLGSLAPDRVPTLITLLDELGAAHGAPYRVRADRGDGRSGRGQSAAWLGLSEGAGRVIRTADRIVGLVTPEVAARQAARRTPAAHLTLARRVDAALISAVRQQTFGPLSVTWEIDSVVLTRSHLEPAGARYETLHTAPCRLASSDINDAANAASSERW